MRIVESKIVAQGIEQWHIGVGVDRIGLTVDVEDKFLAHGVLLPTRKLNLGTAPKFLRQKPEQRGTLLTAGFPGDVADGFWLCENSTVRNDDGIKVLQIAVRCTEICA
jgi:hypothetical protein